MSQAHHDLIESEIDPFFTGTRTKSAALLAWFLEKVWALDPSDVENSICDGGGDKGIDGLVINKDLQEIVVFQSKYCERHNGNEGDAKLKQFTGTTKAYFESKEGIVSLMQSSPNQELLDLLQRNKVADLFEDPDIEYQVREVYVTNCIADTSATDYLATPAGLLIDMWDQERVAAVATRVQRPGLLDETVVFNSPPFLEEQLAPDMKIYFALIPASDLIALPGISDATIFDQNVRLGLGNTKINKELAETILDTTQHALFPAFHNGLTVLTHSVDNTNDNLALTGISVVNGCQSLLTLYRNQSSITTELKVLVRIIEIQEQNQLIDIVTYRTNNQNPVNIRDQRSNSATLRRLQGLVTGTYGTKIYFEIKRGENSSSSAETFENGLAAQMIMAAWRKDAANAVRKTMLFKDETFYRIFAHDIDEHKIYLAYILNKAIEDQKASLLPQLQSSFSSVRFTIAFIASDMMRSGGRGEQLFTNPELWLADKETEVIESVQQFVSLAIDILDNYVTEKISDDPMYRETKDPDFDPKTAFKSSSGVAELARAAQITNRSEARRAAKKSESYFFEEPPVR